MHDLIIKEDSNCANLSGTKAMTIQDFITRYIIMTGPIATGSFVPLSGTTYTAPLNGSIKTVPSIDGMSVITDTTNNGFNVGWNSTNPVSTATMSSNTYYGAPFSYPQAYTTVKSNVGQSQILVRDNALQINTKLTGGNNTHININAGQTNGLTLGSLLTGFSGANYDADYSANYTIRSLIDKGYADARYAPLSYSTSVTNAIAPLSITTNSISLKYSSPLSVSSSSLTIANGAITNFLLASPTWTNNGVPMTLGTSSNSIGAGTGISITSNSIITNTSPNQTVTLTGAGSTTVTGTYPTFTVNSTGGTTNVSATLPLTVTSGTAIAINYSNPLTVTSGSLTVGSGSITNTMLANSTFTINGTSMSLGTSSNTPSGSYIYPVGKSIYFNGDSYTYGTNASSGKRWTTLLCGMLGATEVNNGVPGTTLEKQSPINYIGGPNMVDDTTSIPTKTPSIAMAFCAFGLNDMAQTATAYNVINYKSDYSKVIGAYIRKGWSTKQIVLIPPYYIPVAGYASYTVSTGNPAATRQRHLDFVKATTDVATLYGCLSLNIFNDQLLNDTTLIGTDHIHPTDSGYAYIATAIFQSLQIKQYITLNKIFYNGGNSFGSAATIGTNDNYSLGLRFNNTTPILLDANGFYNNNTSNNTLFGRRAAQTISGTDNSAFGTGALQNSTNAYGNTAIGVNSNALNISGNYNTAVGYYSMLYSTSNNNTSIGSNALLNLASGYYNTALGSGAGTSNVSGHGNVFIGYNAGSSELGSNKLYIDNGYGNTYPLVYGDFQNNYFGINTITPANNLDVNGGATIRGTASVTTSVTTPSISLTSGSSSNLLSGSGTSVIVGNGLSLGGGTLVSNLFSHSVGYGLSGSSFNGSSAISWTADTTVVMSKLFGTAKYQNKINGTGFVKASGTTISYDNSTYLTANQTITLSGDVTGSGATAITASLSAAQPNITSATNLVSIGTLTAGAVPSSLITGTLGVSHGGTGFGLITSGYVPYATGTNVLGSSANLTFDGSSLFSIGSGNTGGFTSRINGNSLFQIQNRSLAGDFQNVYGNGQTEIECTNNFGTLTGLILGTKTTAPLGLGYNNHIYFNMSTGGRIYLGDQGTVSGTNTSATAQLHFAAGATSASGSPLKFTAGSDLSSGEEGAVNYSTGKQLSMWMGATPIKVRIAGTGKPTIAAGTGAGTSPTLSVSATSTDGRMNITVTTGTLPTLSASVFTVTFNQTWGSVPVVTFSPANNNAASLTGVSMVFMDAGASTTTFICTAGTTALTAATTYVWNVHCSNN